MKIAIVTGATGGLGREFVSEILKESIDEIWAVARNENRLNDLKAEFGDKIRTVRCDLANADDLSGLCGLIETEKPDIRLLINNAGIGKMGESIGLTDNDVASEIDINCKAVCLLCNHAIPFMSSGSRILNISSASSFQPVPYINLYAASKAFVRSYTRALNVELKNKGIICTAVCPGWIDTEMLQKEYNGKPVKFPGIVSPNRVAVQALWDSLKGRDMSVCSFFVKYEHFLSKILPHKWIMKIWLSGIKDYVQNLHIPELVRLRIAYMIDDFGSISEYERQCMEEQLEGYGHGQKMISETAGYLDEIRTTLGAL